MASILVVEDEAPLRKSMVIALRRHGHPVTEAGTCAQGSAALDGVLFDLVIADLRLPDGEGLQVLRKVHEGGTETAAVMVSAYGTVEAAVEAMRLGAFDFLEKPFVPERLLTTVARALDTSGCGRAAAPGRGRAPGRDRRTERGDGRGPPADRPGRGRPGGAGDRRDRHRQGARRAGHARGVDPAAPFVVVHCGALPESLIESELFGHVPGAFAGVTTPRRGLLREADGGTVFFDEIAEVPLALQPKLLRFLEHGEVRPVGSDHVGRVDCRVVVASSRDLGEAVRAGSFRRGSAVPPRRVSDRHRAAARAPRGRRAAGRVPPARVAVRLHRLVPGLDPEALELLQAHRWPGNVRELEHTLERALLLAPGEASLPAELLGSLHDDDLDVAAAPSSSDRRSLAAVEKEHILAMLDACGGDRTRTAKTLGISRSTLRRKLIEYDLWKYRT